MRTKDLVLIAAFAAFMAALGLLPRVMLPGGVPITMQSLGPMIAGLILGARRGFLSMALFALLVALGLPLLAGGRGGLGVFAGPTGGFVIGFALAAFVTGWIYQRLAGWPAWAAMLMASILGGIFALYLVGLPYWMLITGQGLDAVLVQASPFLPGDLLKAALATSLGLAVKRGYPAAFDR